MEKNGPNENHGAEAKQAGGKRFSRREFLAESLKISGVAAGTLLLAIVAGNEEKADASCCYSNSGNCYSNYNDCDCNCNCDCDCCTDYSCDWCSGGSGECPPQHPC